MAGISLSAGIRSNLVSLQETTSLLSRTTERLSSGKKVNSPVDNPTNFFSAANLTDRSTGLGARLDSMGQAISTVKAADNGIKSIRSVIGALKGVVNEALSQNTTTQRYELAKRYNSLIVQINTIAKDASYSGTNLLQEGSLASTADRTTAGQSMTVQFNETYNESTLTVQGFNLQGPLAAGEGSALTVYTGSGTTTSGAAIILSARQSSTGKTAVAGTNIRSVSTTNATNTVDFGAATYRTDLGILLQAIETFDEELINQSKNLNVNLNVVTIRQDFTKSFVNVLQEGADKLTLADLNEEGANLLALQTANQLGVQSLSLASQQAQGVLRLLG